MKLISFLFFGFLAYNPSAFAVNDFYATCESSGSRPYTCFISCTCSQGVYNNSSMIEAVKDCKEVAQNSYYLDKAIEACRAPFSPGYGEGNSTGVHLKVDGYYNYGR